VLHVEVGRDEGRVAAVDQPEVAVKGDRPVELDDRRAAAIAGQDAGHGQGHAVVRHALVVRVDVGRRWEQAADREQVAGADPGQLDVARLVAEVGE